MGFEMSQHTYHESMIKRFRIVVEADSVLKQICQSCLESRFVSFQHIPVDCTQVLFPDFFPEPPGNFGLINLTDFFVWYAKAYIDLIIPRGSNAFVRYVMDNTRIPVLGHADGICSIYVDEYANMDIAVPIVLDSKIQYPAACNAVEMVLVNEKIKECFLPQIKKAFNDNGVIIHGDEEVRNTIECESLGEDDLFKEFLSLEVSIKCVKDTAEAIDLINRNGSHHTDAIITENAENKNLFFSLVDSADVFANCSTRFSDGYRFGLGAEVGISTSKIHARGPVGLNGLMSYKWLLEGHGEIVSDYANGKKVFHHKDLV